MAGSVEVAATAQAPGPEGGNQVNHRKARASPQERQDKAAVRHNITSRALRGRGHREAAGEGGAARTSPRRGCTALTLGASRLASVRFAAQPREERER